MNTAAPRTVGVEEELLLVDGSTGVPRAVSGAVLRRAELDPAVPTDDDTVGGSLDVELQQQQLELDTRPCLTLDELTDELCRWRRLADRSARAAGARVAALATSPLPAPHQLTPNPRYRRIVERFGLTAAEQLTSGCHVHVQVADQDEGVAVLDRIRVWLPVLLACSANSPFWQGADTGYASFRSQAWSRWPVAGPTEPFGNPAGYRARVRTLLGSGTVLDEGMLYFDARLSAAYGTVEIRAADVCLDVRDTVLVAALCRAMVETAARDWRDGRPPPEVGVGLLRLAMWRAGRSGLTDELVALPDGRPVSASKELSELLERLGPALTETGDTALVEDRFAVLTGGRTGAARQRQSLERSGALAGVVADAVRATHDLPR